jgi:hypothetical protein
MTHLFLSASANSIHFSFCFPDFFILLVLVLPSLLRKRSQKCPSFRLSFFLPLALFLLSPTLRWATSYRQRLHIDLEARTSRISSRNTEAQTPKVGASIKQRVAAVTIRRRRPRARKVCRPLVSDRKGVGKGHVQPLLSTKHVGIA